MPTVNIQDNPVIAKVGTDASNVTFILLDVGEAYPEGVPVSYQIDNVNTQETITVRSDTDRSKEANILRLDQGTLRIRLESRTKYRARVQAEGGLWSDWVYFKTRDKRYQTPDAITKLSDDSDRTAATTGLRYDGLPMGGSRIIVVTNEARSTETDNQRVVYNAPRAWGPTTVVNTDPIHADVVLQTGGRIIQGGVDKNLGNHQVPIRTTARGATIVTDNTIKFTNRGATINNT